MCRSDIAVTSFRASDEDEQMRRSFNSVFLFFVSCNSLKTKIPTVLQWRRALGEGNKQRNNDVKMQYSNCNYIELQFLQCCMRSGSSGVVRGRQSRQSCQGSSGGVVRVVRVVRSRHGSSGSSGVVSYESQSRQESSLKIRQP